MAFSTYALGSQVGLRLLLSPAGTNVVVQSACVAVGIGFPVYSTFKALEKKDTAEQEQWLTYWAAFGCFSVAEIFSDKLLSWFPLYYHAKLAFLIWLQLPNHHGARYLYMNYLRPYFLKHQDRLDRIVDGTRNEMNNFILSHQKEICAIIQFGQNILSSVYRAAYSAFSPEASPRAIRGADDGTAEWVQVSQED